MRNRFIYSVSLLPRAAIMTGCRFDRARYQSGGPKAGYCVNLGLVLSRLGRLDAAAICYRQALQPDPTDWKTLLKLGRALAGLGHRKTRSKFSKRLLPSAATPNLTLSSRMRYFRLAIITALPSNIDPPSLPGLPIRRRISI